MHLCSMKRFSPCSSSETLEILLVTSASYIGHEILQKISCSLILSCLKDFVAGTLDGRYSQWKKHEWIASIDATQDD